MGAYVCLVAFGEILLISSLYFIVNKWFERIALTLMTVLGVSLVGVLLYMGISLKGLWIASILGGLI